MLEILNYKSNLQDFIDAMQNTFVYDIAYNIDSDPTFNKDSLPFDFKYCFSMTLITEKGNFLIHTAQTSFAIETFWIERAESIDKHVLISTINDRVKSIRSKNGYYGFSYKLTIQFEKDFFDNFCCGNP